MSTQTLNKVNILLALNRLRLGGAENHLQHIAVSLNKEFFNVSVCGIQGGGERLDLLKQLGYDTLVANEDSLRMVEFLKQRQIHLIHWHNSGEAEPFILRAAKEAGVPVVIRTSVFVALDKSAESKLVDTNLFLSKTCFLKYLKIRRQDIEDLYPKNKVIYQTTVDPAEAEHLRPTAQDLMRLRAEYGIKPDEPVIGRIGRADDSKFGIMCIEMMPYLVRLQPKIKFFIVGLTPAKLQRINELRLTGHFVFIEPTVEARKIYPLYYLCNVYVLTPTWGEASGNTLFEAMACRRPVVTNSTPHWDNAQIEVVDHGVTGFVANCPRLLAEAVDFLIRHPDKAEEFGKAGYEKVLRFFDCRKTTKQLERLYLERLQAKGYGFSPQLRDYLGGLGHCFSLEELKGFNSDYRKRLKQSFGRPNFLEVLGYAKDEAVEFLASMVRPFKR